MRRGAGVAVVLVLVGLGIAVFVTAVTPRGASTTITPTELPVDAPAPVIYVHILGHVERPGLYALPEGARAVDAVAAAGGFTADAEAGGLNLARFVSDGEQIVVPAVGEAPVAAAGTSGGLVNLNTADAATLDTLPGVGPATAAKIIAWREQNGRFASIEDLLDVGGIGPSKFDALKDLVTV